MRRLAIAWPKLVGGILALESLGLILWQLKWWWWRAYVTHGHIMAQEIVWLVIALLVATLTYGVYRGHVWARWSVIGAGFCAIAFLFVASAIDTVQSWRRTAEWGRSVTPGGHVSGELLAQLILDVASETGVALCIAAPIALLIALLFHRDVAPQFTTDATKQSNQAMQRTAPRSDA